MEPSRPLVVFGTRPEAIKLAPLIRKLGEHPGISPWVVVTGQHREMLDQVNSLFGVVPDVDLDLGRSGSSLGGLTAEAMARLGEVIVELRPSAVVVQGDTSSTLAGALAAFYNRAPVVHLEAGLRTGNKFAPFPEEMNRLLVTRLTSLHLCATQRNRAALLAEGVPDADIVVTGNTVIDSLLETASKPIAYSDSALDFLDDDPRPMLLVTAHRRESWGPGLVQIGAALAELARDGSIIVVIPVHKNPVVRRHLLGGLGKLDNVIVVEPADYPSFVKLMVRAHIVLTDSGGIQEEAPALGKPVLVMRDETERVEVVQVGAARLVGTTTSRIVWEVRRLLDDEGAYRQMSGAGSPFGDGTAAARATAAIAELLGLGESDLPELSQEAVSIRPAGEG